MNSGPIDMSMPGPDMLEALRRDLDATGVAVLPRFVPEDLCGAARGAIDAFGGFGDGPRAWYGRPAPPGGVVPVHQHPAFWDIRQHPALYGAFRALLGTPFLWVSMDRGSFKPPFRPDLPDQRDDSPFHWDTDPRDPPRRLQGLVYLDDCAQEQGAFQCVPHLFRNPRAWLAIHGPAPFPEARMRAEQILRVGAPIGSLVLWDARLPHGCGLNLADRPRYALSLTMFREGDAERRAERIRTFEANRAPAFWRGVPGQQDPEPGPRASLDALGERLLGRVPW